MPEWKTRSAQRMRRNPTAAEAAPWERLRLKRLDGLRFRQQAPLYGYIADFYCPSLGLVVEVDGEYHLERADYDSRRDAQLRAHGLTVVRLTNGEVLGDMPTALERVRVAAESVRTRNKGEAA